MDRRRSSIPTRYQAGGATVAAMTGNKIASVLAAAALAVGCLIGVAAPASATVGPVGSSVSASVLTASPRPGQFCARADRGDVVKTARYGRLKCKADPNNSRYSRWYHW